VFVPPEASGAVKVSSAGVGVGTGVDVAVGSGVPVGSALRVADAGVDPAPELVAAAFGVSVDDAASVSVPSEPHATAPKASAVAARSEVTIPRRTDAPLRLQLDGAVFEPNCIWRIPRLQLSSKEHRRA
jgi:hypothetical protein